MTSSTDSPPVALSIAGSDSGGGAGIQADLKAMTHRGVHGCTALTALTAQNSVGVQGIEPVDSGFLRKQIQSVTSDFDVSATKTGMLFNESNIRVVVEETDDLGKLVVDPVMVAESGDSLLEEAAEDALVNELLPEADLITPNWTETQHIAQRLDLSTDEAPSALGETLAETLQGPAVLVKGGHLEGDEATDWLINRTGDTETFSAERFDTANTHGSGCVYSSLITAELAKGRTLTEAIRTAKSNLTDAIGNSYACGEGPGTLNLLRSGKE
ncbi:MAG: bifunctional hydroxymethylpyrimidine kinase/phosphomethylpyrimidine kinase [bacterium]